MKLRVFWDVAPFSLVAVQPTFQWCVLSSPSGRRMIALMMEVVCTSETLVYSNEATRRYIPEDSNLHIRRRKNLKSHNKNII
jgi:hypothetical protein